MIDSKQIKKALFGGAFAILSLGIAASAHAQAVFNHTALCSKDLKKSNEFYTSVLKLKIVPNPFKDTVHTWYSIAPHIAMHVIQSGCSTTPKVIADHLCFSVPSVTKFVEMLKSKNIPYCNWKQVPGQIEHRVDGVQQVYIQDPDGYWIEVNDAK
ncbi:VOC family protein [Mucilaginibacter litoreus]|uniref:VOC family protein n=1 Tax=Mucilaginibacter litoreus TaxID=1048221 RepID=A0ABW3APY8_9SPHI